MSTTNSTATRPAQDKDDMTFIVITGPESLKDRQIQQHARTAAILNSNERNRRQARKNATHFRYQTVSSMSSSRTTKPDKLPHGLWQERHRQNPNSGPPSATIRTLGAATIDPFESLPVNAARLTELMHLSTSGPAGEPIFNLRDITSFGALQTVFGTGLCDPSLSSALSMTFVLASNNWQTSQESFEFESMAIQNLNRRLQCHDTMIEPTTIGVVIIFLGIEYRLKRMDRVKSHLQGIKGLLHQYQLLNIKMNDTLRRSIFWQDMLCSIVSGTDRILDYSFYPSVLPKDSDKTDPRQIPEGLQECEAILSDEILDVAAQVKDLYTHRDRFYSTNPTNDKIEHMDSLQALLESRLQDLSRCTSDPAQQSCILALFLCVYGFWDGIWKASLLPKSLTRSLLQQLQLSISHLNDMLYKEFLLWLVCIGHSFAYEESVREEFVQLQSAHCLPSLEEQAALDILNKFIWSKVFYDSKKGFFWQHIDNAMAL